MLNLIFQPTDSPCSTQCLRKLKPLIIKEELKRELLVD